MFTLELLNSNIDFYIKDYKILGSLDKDTEEIAINLYKDYFYKVLYVDFPCYLNTNSIIDFIQDGFRKTKLKKYKNKFHIKKLY